MPEAYIGDPGYLRGLPPDTSINIGKELLADPLESGIYVPALQRSEIQFAYSCKKV